MKLTSYFQNGWNWIHFAGGWAGILSIYLISGNITWSIVITSTVDIIKEILDSVSSRTVFRGRFGLDPSGGDIKDILMCSIGILVGFVIIYFQKN